MINNRGDGGPAFPGTKRVGQFNGMTLRDYFAGQALAGLMVQDIGWLLFNNNNQDRAAELAVQLADALLNKLR